MKNAFVLIEAPSSLGLMSNGVERLPARLIELGLAEALQARRGAQLPVPRKGSQRDPETGTLNAQAMASWSVQLADAVEQTLDLDGFPLILGGDCTIVLGSMLALRRRGRYGLLFIDGNADFFQPDAEPNGEGASMDLAFVTGFGPQLLTNLEGLAPLARPEDVVAFSFRDQEDQREYGSRPLPPQLKAMDLQAVRRMGIEAAAHAAVTHLTRPGLDGFFVHVDVDCLHDSLMPAVDFRVPDGLSWQELQTVLQISMASNCAVGLEITIYNPELDADGSAGRGLVEVLRNGLVTPE